MNFSPGAACVAGCVRRESRVCWDSFRFTCFSIPTTCGRTSIAARSRDFEISHANRDDGAVQGMVQRATLRRLGSVHSRVALRDFSWR